MDKVRNLMKKLKTLATTGLAWAKAHPVPVAIVLGVIVILYGTFMVAALRIRHRVADYLIESTGGELQYKKIRVTPSLQIELDDVTLKAKDSPLSLPDLKARKVVARADLGTFLGGKVKVVEVGIDSPEVSIYKGPDGTFNLSKWFGKMSVCTDTGAGAAVPNRVTIHKGRIMLEPLPGSSRVDATEIARVDGYLGRTVENNVAFKARAVVFKSSVVIEGGLIPCSAEGFKVSANTDNFDFSALRDLVESVSAGNIPTKRMPTGSGALNMTAEGTFDNPTLKGRASLRDFDTEFWFAEGVLHISDLHAGIGGERLSGSGLFDFSKPDIPFKLDIEMKKLRTERIFRKVFGFRTAPEGDLSGHVYLRGSLGTNTLRWDNGEITVEDGVVKIPPVGGSSGSSLIAVPFNKLTARLNGSGDRLNFINIVIESDIFTANGSASIGAGSGSALIAPDSPYSLSLKFDVEEAEAAAELIPSLHERVGGRLTGSIDISGVFKQKSGFSGAGTLSLRDGFIANPYAEEYGSLGESIQLDAADAQFTLSSDAVEIKNVSLAGNGIYITARGSVAYDGPMSLLGKAQLSPEWAVKFSGLSRYIDNEAPIGAEMFEAGFSVRGTFQSPEQAWMRPTVTGAPSEGQGGVYDMQNSDED